MSFRELRNFCEVMRSLGYHRLISMENFRSPNFELVADILDWLLHRFEPGLNIPDDISTEEHRVMFIKAVVEKVVDRTGVKMNPRKLYGADGFAVKEMLKLANVLYEAQQSIVLTAPEGVEENFSLNSKVSDLKSTRTLCSEIVETGAALFDSLQKEKDMRPDRSKALNFLDGISRDLQSNSGHEAIERAVSGHLNSNSTNLQQLKQMTEELTRDEKNLEQKIKKQRLELDRCQKRLASLVNVRPAFMDEYETMEQELERYYEQYVGRFRNLDFLEHELDELNRMEQERMEENERALKKMQKRLRDEEWRLLRGEEDAAGDKKKSRARGGGGLGKTAGSRNKQMPGSSEVFGSMGDGENSEPSSDASDASASDSDPPISVGGSEGSEQPPMSLGNSGSDDDILNESDDEDDVSDDDDLLMGGGGGGFKNMHSDHAF